MLCAHHLCMCITNVYYSVLVKLVCSIHVFVLYVHTEFVVIITMQPYIYTCFRVTCKPMGLGHDVIISHYVL